MFVYNLIGRNSNLVALRMRTASTWKKDAHGRERQGGPARAGQAAVLFSLRGISCADRPVAGTSRGPGTDVPAVSGHARPLGTGNSQRQGIEHDFALGLGNALTAATPSGRGRAFDPGAQHRGRTHRPRRSDRSRTAVA